MLRETRQPCPADDDYDRVECLVCGRTFVSLSAHITRIHRLSCLEYRAEFGPAPLFARALRQRLSRSGSRGLDPGQPYAPLTAAEIVARLRRYARECRPLSASWLQDRHRSLYAQAQAMFGGWSKAMAAAGLARIPRRAWSRALVLETLRQRHRERQPLNASAIARQLRGLAGAAVKLFGSYPAAVRAAGLDYSKIQRHGPVSKAEVCRRLQAWVRRHGELTPGGLSRSDRALFAIAGKKFGSVDAAARAARVPCRRQREQWCRDRVAHELRQRALQGLAVHATAIVREQPRLYGAMLRYFGSSRKACAAAGLGADQDEKSTTQGTPTDGAPRYWLNTENGVRHNERCKYFKKTTAGRLCGPTDGKACGSCSG